MAYTPIDKLENEVEKLQLEIKILKRPFVLQPTSWITLIGLILSISVNLSQCSKAQNEKILADINLARVRLDINNLEKSRDSLSKDSSILHQKILNANTQFDDVQRRIQQAENLLAQIKPSQDSVKTGSNNSKVINELRESLQTIGVLNQHAQNNFKAAGSFSKTATANLSVALEKEREGFQHLIDQEYKDAVIAFRASENAYNGYHWVYELSRFLKSQLPILEGNDAGKKNDIIRQVINKYAAGAPQDLFTQLKETLN